MLLNFEIAPAPADKSVIRKDLQETFNASGGFHKIVDIINSPNSDLTSSTPFSSKDEDWNSRNPNPTPKQYFDQWIKESTDQILSTLSDDGNVMFPKKEDWIDLHNTYLNDEGLQRNQLKNRKTQRNVWKNAVNFKFTMARVEAEYIDIEGHPLNGCYNIWDGGGTVTAALLRNIRYLPAKVSRVTEEEEIGTKFFDLANSVESVAGEETFKHRYYMEEPLAVLQARIYKSTDTTPMDHHPNRQLKKLAITALKKTIQETFCNADETSISGDPKLLVKAESLFEQRECRNIIESLEVIQTNWEDESPIVPAVFKEFTRFYATFSNSVTLRRFNQMIKDYKKGVVSINGSDILSYGVARGKIDWNTQNKLSTGLGLQDNTDSHRSYGTYVLAKCWNNWAKSQMGVKTISQEFLDKIIHEGKSSAFHYNKF